MARRLVEPLDGAPVLAEFGAQLAEQEIAARNVLAALTQPFDFGKETRASLRGELPQIPLETFGWGFVAGHHASALQDSLLDSLLGLVTCKRQSYPLGQETAYIFGEND